MNRLPYEKASILDAIMEQLAIERRSEFRTALGIGALSLAFYQEGVGRDIVLREAGEGAGCSRSDDLPRRNARATALARYEALLLLVEEDKRRIGAMLVGARGRWRTGAG